MTLTEKLKLNTAVKLFGSTAAGVGYKLAKSGAQELTEEMQNELEDAMLLLVLQYNDMHVQLEKLKVENAELKAKGGFDFGSFF